MIRESRFFISKGLYAVDPDGLRVTTRQMTYSGGRTGHTYHSVRVGAVWFRRRRGVTVACIGELWCSTLDAAPTTVTEALARMTDGRYGGAWIARWDGERYVSEHPQAPEVMQRHMGVLRPMLDAYPAIPFGYDGWYRYETGAEARAVRALASTTEQGSSDEQRSS